MAKVVDLQRPGIFTVFVQRNRPVAQSGIDGQRYDTALDAATDQKFMKKQHRIAHRIAGMKAGKELLDDHGRPGAFMASQLLQPSKQLLRVGLAAVPFNAGSGLGAQPLAQRSVLQHLFHEAGRTSRRPCRGTGSRPRPLFRPRPRHRRPAAAPGKRSFRAGADRSPRARSWKENIGRTVHGQEFIHGQMTGEKNVFGGQVKTGGQIGNGMEILRQRIRVLPTTIRRMAGEMYFL